MVVSGALLKLSGWVVNANQVVMTPKEAIINVMNNMD